MISESLALATATSMINSLVEELFVPQFKKFQKTAKIKSSELLNRNKGYFNEYLIRTYERYSIINALAIPNSQFQLKDIYVTQTIVKGNRFESEADSTQIERLPVDLIKKYKRILITDTAGMGKSTIMKYMFIDLIDNCIKDVGIPIYIELNRLNRDRSILIEIQEELNSLSKEFDNDLLLNFIQKGGFIFFLDGYDEISISDRNVVTTDIQTFISKAGMKNYFILTSRPEDSIASFGDFQSFNIQPLAIEEAFELLSKYDITKQKKVSKELIKELQTGNYSSINEYLENPLLVSLLYSAFNYKAEIPLKKHLFYRQVYDALYNAHKLAQGQKPHEKRSGLDIDDFNRVLRYVGYECLISIGVQFDKDTILKSICRAKDFCGNLKFGESSFLDDLMTSVPVLTKDGTEYKWAHKSLMEYFAARFIADDAKDNLDKYLTAIYNSEHIYRYVNMLDIYYDIDYKGFSKNIMLPLLEEFVSFHDGHYPTTFNVDLELIEARIALFFPYCLVGIIRKDLFVQKEEARSDWQNSFYNNYIKDNEKWRSTNYGYYDVFVMSGFKSQKNNKTDYLPKLLFTKHPELFLQYDTNPETVDRNLYTDQKIYKIDIMTGDHDINHFCLINSLLARTDYRFCPNYLNYKAVKNIINRIKRQIEGHQLDLMPS